ncbi:hypothetical protein GT045_11345 [Streptomyces sp. SID486]|uniref:hypothetical protein n=1 Tax=Streptomyces sp. SID486 TaxID=2690264 RepID=UPI00136E216C|nr:hypothetical protein [Streptomyces sp. SID486]MYX95389.1 hypothetical protein [Streptomyces sp. SID486]
MRAFIACIKATHRSNWDICKNEGLWGVPGASNNAKKAAEMVQAGDVVFVWFANGPSRDGGLRAKVRASAAAGVARNAPWPDADRYSHTFPMEVVRDLGTCLPDRFPGNRASEVFGVENIWLNWGFWHIEEEAVVESLERCFLIP